MSMTRPWLFGEALPFDALTVVDQNAASDIFILEGRRDLSPGEQMRLDLAYAIQAWVGRQKEMR